MNRADDGLPNALVMADPIDGPGLTHDWNTSPAAAALLDALMAEPDDQLSEPTPTPGLRRRTRPALAASAAACAALALVVVGLPGTTTRASAIRPLDDGRIVIDWNATRYHGRELVEDLRAYGLDVKIASEDYASPSMVGQVVAHNLNTDESDPKRWPPGVTLGGPDGSPGVFTWIIDPAVFDTTIPVDIYVETPPGEDYRVSQSVFHSGEPLQGARCSLSQPLEPGRAAALAEAAGLDVRWSVETPTSHDATSWGGSFQDSAAIARGTVVGDQQLNAHTVEFTVRPPGDWPAIVADSDREYISHLQADCP